MRKFVAQYSSGLRVRLNPSLQSEQVGIIKPNGIISFIDEVKLWTVYLKFSGRTVFRDQLNCSKYGIVKN